LPLNCDSEAPLVVKNVAAVPSGPTKVNGPDALLEAATWNRSVVLTGVTAVQESVVQVADEPVTAPLSFTEETKLPELCNVVGVTYVAK